MPFILVIVNSIVVIISNKNKCMELLPNKKECCFSDEMDLGADKAAMIIKEENEVVMVEVKAAITIKVNKVEDEGAMIEVDGKTAMTEVEDEATTTAVEVRVAEAEMAINRLVYKQNVIL
jgi:hypothetical protein